MKHIFKSDEIKTLGFTWPHPHVPGEYIETDENGLIDLKESIQSLKGQIFSDEKIVSAAFSFRSSYGGQMSVLEYSDFKDSYDVNRERLSRCKRALQILETILDKANK